jgi:hypothetical protein
MQIATTSTVGTLARILWTAPASNGEVISAYEVQILHYDGVSASQAPSCTGAALVAAL